MSDERGQLPVPVEVKSLWEVEGKLMPSDYYNEAAQLLKEFGIESDSELGNVLVIGPSEYAPEAYGMVEMNSDDPNSAYLALRKGIKSLTLVDRSKLPDKSDFSIYLIDYLNGGEGIKVNFGTTLETFAKDEDNLGKFDTIIMLRPQNLNALVREGLFEQLDSLVASKGVVVVTGDKAGVESLNRRWNGDLNDVDKNVKHGLPEGAFEGGFDVDHCGVRLEKTS